RRASGGGHDLELTDAELAHAWRTRHRGIAPRRRHAGGEHDEGGWLRFGAVLAKKAFERLEEPARPAGELGSGLGAGRLPGDALDRATNAGGSGGERHPDAPKRQRADHGGVERSQLRGQAFNRASQLRVAPGAEGFLIDDENEAAPRADAVIRPVRWRDARSGRRWRGRSRDAPQRADRSRAI